MRDEYPPEVEGKMVEYKYSLTIRLNEEFDSEDNEESVHTELLGALKNLVDSNYIDQYELEWD